MGGLLGFARAYAGERVYALRNEAVVGEGNLQSEVSGLVIRVAVNQRSGSSTGTLVK